MVSNGWIYEKRLLIKTAIRVVFGAVWLIDGAFKFLFNSPSTFAQMMY